MGCHCLNTLEDLSLCVFIFLGSWLLCTTALTAKITICWRVTCQCSFQRCRLTADISIQLCQAAGLSSELNEPTTCYSSQTSQQPAQANTHSQAVFKGENWNFSMFFFLGWLFLQYSRSCSVAIKPQHLTPCSNLPVLASTGLFEFL